MKRRTRTAVRRLRSAVVVSIVGLAMTAAADLRAQTKVIVNTDVEVTSITQAEIARIYLGKKTFWDSGARIEPSLLDEDSPLTASFLEENLKKTVRQFRAYWKRHLFSGQGAAPKTFATSKQVADFVAANPGAIGIVDGSYTDDRVKFIELKP
jgi:ABC-type phosphate transport system substrate-binding protein